MKEGLLIFDDRPTPLAQKVALAVVVYRKKFGNMPNKCYANPSELMPSGLPESSQIVAAQMMVGDVEVEPLKTVPRCHFWVGIEERRSEEPSQGGVKESG